MRLLLNVIEKILMKTARKETFFIARTFILVAEGLRSYTLVTKCIVIWIFHKPFHKTLVKTKVKEAFFLFFFFPIFMLYCEGRDFSSRRFEIVKLIKHFILKWICEICIGTRQFCHKLFDKSLVKTGMKEVFVSKFVSNFTLNWPSF